MPEKKNPLGLNPLQLKTLTLMQELARHPETSTRDPDLNPFSPRRRLRSLPSQPQPEQHRCK